MKLLYLFIFSMFLFSCGSRCIVGKGEPVLRSEKVAAFHSVVVEGPYEVELVNTKAKSGTPAKVSSYMHENLREYIHYEIEDSVLTIRSNRCIQSPEPVAFTLANSEYRGVLNSGSGRIFCKSPLAGDSVYIANSGSGNIELQLRVEKSYVRNEGSGNVVLGGFTRETEATQEGSGNIEAKDIRTDKAVVTNSGSGTLFIHCGGSIDVYLRGSGNIEVYGNPASYRQTVEGSGTVIRNALLTR